MGFRGITQGEIMFHTQCELPRRNPPEHIASAFFEADAIGSIVSQRRPGEKQRTFGAQYCRVKGRYWSTRLPVEH